MTCSVEIGHMKYQCALIWPRRMLLLWQMWLVMNMHISPNGWSSCCWSPALSSWLEQQRYEALSDTANTAIVPWFHIVIGQDRSGNRKIITLMEPLMTWLYMLQYMNGWINGSNDELFHSKWKKTATSKCSSTSWFLEIPTNQPTNRHPFGVHVSHVD